MDRRNSDTGLTPQEEEELLSFKEDGEVNLNEEAEALFDESEAFGLLMETHHPQDDMIVEIPSAFDLGDPLNLTGGGPQTSTPLKQEMSGEDPSPRLKTSPEDDFSCIEGFKFPRTITITRSKPLEKRPEPGPEVEILREIKSVPKKRATGEPQIERTNSHLPEAEIEILEDGEIPSVDEKAPSREFKMGNQVSLPRMLKAVVKVLEEGEIEDEDSGLENPTPRETPAEGNENPAAPQWRKNGGQGVKGMKGLRNDPARVSGRRREASGEPSSRQISARGRPLSPFRDRSVESLPDVEKINSAGRPFRWRERGGSLARGSRITPCDFRPGYHPKKRELRSDGIVTQKERALVLERDSRKARKEGNRVSQTEEKGKPVPAKQPDRDVRKALAELEKAGEKYREMLANFAAKYDAGPDEEPLKKRARQDDPPNVLQPPGPSTEDPGSCRRVEPEETGSDGDAVEVRRAEPETSENGPIFYFSPPTPVVWPLKTVEEARFHHEERETLPDRPAEPQEAESLREGPSARNYSEIGVLQGGPPVRGGPMPGPGGPQPAIPRPLPDIVLDEGQVRGLAPRIAGPRPNRVRAPEPDPINRQGGRIGRPGTGSLATRERRMRRERAMRMEAKASRGREAGSH